jgi:hypothetical protein
MEEFIEEKIVEMGRKKAYIILLAITLIIGLVISFYVNKKVNQVTFDGSTYTVNKYENERWELISDSNELMYVSSKRNNRKISIYSEWKIEKGQNTYKIYRGDNFDLVVELNGEIIGREKAVTFDDEVTGSLNTYKQVADVVNNKMIAVLAYLLIFNISLIPLGCLNVINPYISWQMKMMFITQGGKPTKVYKVMTRITGIIMILVGMFYSLRLIS